jgi:hypothetical protein
MLFTGLDETCMPLKVRFMRIRNLRTIPRSGNWKVGTRSVWHAHVPSYRDINSAITYAVCCHPAVMEFPDRTRTIGVSLSPSRSNRDSTSPALTGVEYPSSTSSFNYAGLG